jgi:DNA (cytosine-5)-methyltransferase 1
MPLRNLPVVDLFAGPGGLGEGFESFEPKGSRPRFHVSLSIECDDWAHQTLELRTFFRQFKKDGVPKAYYDYLLGEISREELFGKYPSQARAAADIARKATLGEGKSSTVDKWIKAALGPAHSTGHWILVGGPPCQAYSLVGRARRTRETRESFESDSRHYLYKEYLRILRRHKPAVFVMENVKGILSATLGGERIFGKICEDLAAAGYELHSVSGEPARDLALGWNPSSFVVRAECYGIPQTRHRVFIVGVRKDLGVSVPPAPETGVTGSVQQAIGDLPPLKSRISKKVKSSADSWTKARDAGLALAKRFANGAGTTANRASRRFKKILNRSNPLGDSKLTMPVNHESRGHIAEDVTRYAFVSAFALAEGRSPKLDDFPKALLPNHRNAVHGSKAIPFADRFRAQLANRPSSTITSHISKDGHYYIHPDPMQARSLTVREAARLQTFPDNYFFEGPRTEQYRQVGNAVPPLLAKQIAAILSDVLK